VNASFLFLLYLGKRPARHGTPHPETNLPALHLYRVLLRYWCCWSCEIAGGCIYCWETL
jgi:hypothetical protein